MSELPKGWVLTKFGNILLSLKSGLNGKQNKTGEGIPVSRIETIANQRIDMTRIGFLKDYDEEKIKKYRLHEGNILFSNINSPAHLGKTALCEKGIELYHGVNLLRLTVNEGIIPSLLNYYCKYIRGLGEFSAKAQHAVNQSSLNQTKLKDFDIPLAPLNEQIRIADKLDSMLAKVDAVQARLDKIPNILKRFRQSVLAAATSGELTKEWRGKNKHQTIDDILTELDGKIEDKKAQIFAKKEFSNSEIKQQIPKSWRWIRLCGLTEVVSGVAKGSQTKEEVVSLPYLRVANVQRGYLDLTEVKNIDVPKSRALKLLLKDGDVLFNEGGDIDKLGRGWIWEGQVENCIHQNHVFRARVLTYKIQPRYLSYYGNETAREYFLREGTQTVNLANLNKTTLSLLPVPLPPADEQKEIVRRVESLLSMANTVEKQFLEAKARTNRLTQSILAKAFRGELVPQDPNDEPASELLARIKQEQAKLKPTKTRKRKVVQ